MNENVHLNVTLGAKDAKTTRNERSKIPSDARPGDILRARELRKQFKTFLGELELSGVKVSGSYDIFPDGTQCFAKIKVDEVTAVMTLAEKDGRWVLMWPVMDESAPRLRYGVVKFTEQDRSTPDQLMDLASFLVRLVHNVETGNQEMP